MQKNNLTPKKPIDKSSKKKALLLVALSLCSLFLYYGLTSLNIPFLAMATMITYMIAFAAFLIAYIVYNRAFTRKDITVDMLPDIWTDEEKENYINDGKMRLEKSKWMLMVIIPLLVTFAAEALYLFVFQGLLAPMFKNL